MSWIALATEDELSEQVGLTLAAEVGLNVGERLRKGGNGYLRSRIHNFCAMAAVQPVIVLSDLDQQLCASELISAWLGARKCPQNLLIRIAVREIESWLLADHVGMVALLGKGIAGQLPDGPDAVIDPKRLLLNLARRAPRRIRGDLLPADGAISSQGLGYNNVLCNFVRSEWNAGRAEIRSPSLRRARERLQALALRVTD